MGVLYRKLLDSSVALKKGQAHWLQIRAGLFAQHLFFVFFWCDPEACLTKGSDCGSTIPINGRRNRSLPTPGFIYAAWPSDDGGLFVSAAAWGLCLFHLIRAKWWGSFLNSFTYARSTSLHHKHTISAMTTSCFRASLPKFLQNLSQAEMWH